MDRWMGMWVDGERGILFHMTLCRWGQPLTPTLCFSSPDGLCLWLDWQFLPLLGILAFLLIMRPPHPPACGCLLLSERFHLCWSSLVSRGSIFCPSAYSVSCQHLTISHVVSYSPDILKKNPQTTSCFTGWTKVRCENNIKEDKSTYTPHSMKVKCQKYSGTENFSNASEIHSNSPRSHTLMNLYLPRLTRENIFDKQDHTVLSPPGLLCLHGNIRGVVMLLSPILDQLTLFIHFICLNGLHFFFFMCISLCLFQSICIKKHRRIIIRSIFTRKCQNDMNFTRLPENG